MIQKDGYEKSKIKRASKRSTNSEYEQGCNDDDKRIAMTTTMREA